MTSVEGFNETILIRGALEYYLKHNLTFTREFASLLFDKWETLNEGTRSTVQIVIEKAVEKGDVCDIEKWNDVIGIWCVD